MLLEKMVARALPALLGPATAQTLSVLIYHRVLPNKDFLRPSVPTVSEFEWQMEMLSRNFTPLTIAAALEMMAEGSLPRNSVCVTFDDGYADNYQLALPVLEKWKVPATVFVASGFLNGGRMWNDTIIESVRILSDEYLDLRDIDLDTYPIATEDEKLQTTGDLLRKVKYLSQDHRYSVIELLERMSPGLPESLMLTDQQLVEMNCRGMDIGGHTVNHPILAVAKEEEAREEIVANKRDLESIIGEAISFFAFPNGIWNQDFDQTHIDLVKEAGYKAAFSTTIGISSPASDCYRLPRYTPWERTRWKFLVRLLLNQSRRG